jgi:hypothetical protein
VMEVKISAECAVENYGSLYRETHAMIKHWHIRNCLIVLTAFFIVVWMGSYWQAVNVGYWGREGAMVGIEWGRIELDWTNHPSPTAPRWIIDRGSAYGYASNRGLLGFAFSKDVINRWLRVETVIPLWFPTLFCDILLLLFLRTPTPKPAGFPVELLRTAEVR